MRRQTLPVAGIACRGCERTVERALRSVDGVTRADADHERDAVEVVVADDVSDDDVRAAIERAGYDVD